MDERTEKNRISFKKLFMASPAAHVMALVGAVLIALQLLLKNNAAVMLWESEHIVRPYHRAMGKLCSAVDLSVASIIIYLLCAGVLVYIIFEMVEIIRKSGRWKRCYRLVSTLLALVVLIYGGFCQLWGVYYYASDFGQLSGIHAQPISTDKLECVTRYFTLLVNEYDRQIARDENGDFAEDVEKIFDGSVGLYDNVEKLLPFLREDGLRAKPFVGSRFLSYFQFTGFFFPFTGEANINVHSPAAFIPSTIAHELAHQRGVAAENEANFVAVLASL